MGATANRRSIRRNATGARVTSTTNQALARPFGRKVQLQIAPCPALASVGGSNAELIEWTPGVGPRVVARIEHLGCEVGRAKNYVFNYDTRADRRYQIYIWNLTHQTPEFQGGTFKSVSLCWDGGRLIPS